MTSAGSRRSNSHWFRILRSVVEVALAVVAGYAIFAQRRNFALAIGLFAHLRWGWVGIAILAEMASMGAFARMQRWLLRIGGTTLHLWAMIEITLAGNALSVSLPGGAAWSTVWALDQLRRREAPRHLVVWVLVVSGVLSSVTISGILIAGVWIAGDKGPSSDLRWPLLAVAITLIGGSAILVFHQRSRTARGATSKHLARFSSESRVRKAIEEIGRYARTVDPRWQDWIASLFFALMNWLTDIGCLVASIVALHITVPCPSHQSP
ncbi:lysylphosphatidylglycerol synthase domain-containing protein [Ferrimicrobium sp.]|uniref:lysylphosphatidylglycerol synthase domain-containing protein n=1 Tax=Ferrimicrobium sp. TaxID=2926050 RepID=UPI00262FF75A|nr:lysylphosphatidylglycerol synthase domain-containing protein [Ferrimicrobium sp.]